MKNKRYRTLNKMVNKKEFEVQQHKDKFRLYATVQNRAVTDWCTFKVIIKYIESGTF